MTELQPWVGRAPLPDVLGGEDRSFGGGLFVDLIPDSCWFTNVRSCVGPLVTASPPSRQLVPWEFLGNFLR
jgi:hypothetical protein